jgi:hypothetical protein
MSQPKVLRLSIDKNNPLHERVNNWLLQFERGQGRRSRRSSYHLLAAMMLYIDVKEGRAQVIPIGQVIPIAQVIPIGQTAPSSERSHDEEREGRAQVIPTGQTAPSSDGVMSSSPAGVIIPVSPAADVPSLKSDKSSLGAQGELTPVLQRSIIGDAGFGSCDY